MPTLFTSAESRSYQHVNHIVAARAFLLKRKIEQLRGWVVAEIAGIAFWFTPLRTVAQVLAGMGPFLVLII